MELSWVMDIYLIRLTTPEIAIDVCYGQTDMSVGPLLEKEAADVKKRLNLDLPVFYSNRY
jgi:hypothetical protein